MFGTKVIFYAYKIFESFIETWNEMVEIFFVICRQIEKKECCCPDGQNRDRMEKEKMVEFGLSVCIPIYNWSVVDLVNVIRSQSLSLGFDFEILLVDDCSSSHKEENRSLRSLSHVNYTELEQNVGRSAIRNRLAESAKYNILIFMDCDTKVISDRFIADYLSNARFPVVVGGYSYTEDLQNESCRLRWVYGKRREERRAVSRSGRPNRSFSTFNFMIRKDVFKLVRFDEDLSGYGHEDTLFGWELRLRNIMIKHIDNPLLHLSLDDSPTYIRKTENSLNNLWIIYNRMTDKKGFCEEIKVLKCYVALRHWGLSVLLTMFFPLMKRLIYRNLLSSRPNMFFFDIYKLGILNETASSC